MLTFIGILLVNYYISAHNKLWIEKEEDIPVSVDIYRTDGWFLKTNGWSWHKILSAKVLWLVAFAFAFLPFEYNTFNLNAWQKFECIIDYINNFQLRLPSEHYFYMEPPTTLAVLNEHKTMVCLQFNAVAWVWLFPSTIEILFTEIILCNQREGAFKQRPISHWFRFKSRNHHWCLHQDKLPVSHHLGAALPYPYMNVEWFVRGADNLWVWVFFFSGGRFEEFWACCNDL